MLPAHLEQSPFPPSGRTQQKEDTVPSTSTYPLTFLTTISQALRSLETLGVEPQQFMQRLLEDRGFRQSVALLFDPSLEQQGPELAAVRDDVVPAVLYQLVKDTISYWRYLSDSEAAAYLKRFNNVDGLRELAADVRKEDFEILADRRGLYTGSGMHRSDIAAKYGMSQSQVQTREKRAMDALRFRIRALENIEETARQAEEDERIQHIRLLMLSDRVRIILLRAGIETIPQLVDKTELDLFRDVPQFGHVALSEVKQQLATRGLQLRDIG